jgi:hypothetical protein
VAFRLQGAAILRLASRHGTEMYIICTQIIEEIKCLTQTLNYTTIAFIFIDIKIINLLLLSRSHFLSSLHPLLSLRHFSRLLATLSSVVCGWSGFHRRLILVLQVY